jgi:hypothetical protein
VVCLCRCDRDGEPDTVKIARTTDALSIPTELLAIQSVWSRHVINCYEMYVDPISDSLPSRTARVARCTRSSNAPLPHWRQFGHLAAKSWILFALAIRRR